MERKSNKGLIFLVIILLIGVIGLGGYIVYDKVINKDNEPKTEKKEEAEQTNEKSEKKEVSSDIQKELLDLVGIDLSNEQQQIIGTIQGVLLNNNEGEIHNYSYNNKLSLIYLYGMNHQLIDQVSGQENAKCNAGDGYCKAVTKENYDMIAKRFNISDSADVLFKNVDTFYELWNGKYLFWMGVFGGSQNCKHNVSFDYEGENIILQDNVTLDGKENRKIVYTFNSDGINYNLLKIENK